MFGLQYGTMKYWVSIFCVLISHLLAMGKLAFGDQENGKFRAAMHGLAPYVFVQDGKYLGLMPDVYRFIGKETGIEFSFAQVATKRMIAQFESGSLDIGIFYRTPRLEAVAIPIIELENLANVAVGLKGVDIKAKSDLEKFTVAVLRGGFFEDHFKANPAWKYIPVTNYQQAVSVLKRGRVDAVIGAAEGVFYNLQQAGVSVEELGEPYLYSSVSTWAFISKFSPLLEREQELKHVFERLLHDCMNDKVMKRYLEPGMIKLLRRFQKASAERCDFVFAE